MEPPVLPIPYAKTLVYPLDSERYTKPKLTSFFFKNTQKLLCPINQNIPIDDLIMDSDKYNINADGLILSEK